MVSTPDSPAPASPPAPGQGRPKVIYVMGQGKSGSTILGVTLGNCTGMFFGGELCTWLMTGGRPVLGGRERLRFWRGVLKDVAAPVSIFGGKPFHLYERSLAAFRVDRWPARRRMRAQYREVTENLYRSIAARTGAEHVIDTSHLPMRGYELQGIEGIDLYVIFLVRDVESVVASYTHHVKPHDAAERRRRFVTMNTHLWMTYLLSIFVFLRQPAERRLLLRHEDFIADPEGILRELLDFVGSDSEIPDLSALKTGVPFKGNRLIRSEVVALKAKAAEPHRSSRLLQVVQGPWELVLSRLRPVATGARGKRAASPDPARGA